MKRALIKGAAVTVTIAVIELAMLMTGYATLDETSTTGPIEGATYIPSPNWLYIALPLMAGLATFLWTWHKDVQTSQQDEGSTTN